MHSVLRMTAGLLVCAGQGCWCTSPTTRCSADIDCPSGYRCDPESHVCTFSDAGAAVDGAAVHDAAVDDAAVDGAAVDGAAVHDAASHDAAVRDAAAPDVEILDMGAGDAAGLDVPRPDAAADASPTDRSAADLAQPDQQPLDAPAVDQCHPNCAGSCGGEDGCGGFCPDPCNPCTSSGCDQSTSDYTCLCLPGHEWNPSQHVCVYQHDGELSLAAGETFNLASDHIGDDRNGCADGVTYSVTSISGSAVTVDRIPGCCLGRGHTVLIINLRGADEQHINVGNYETATVSHVAGNQVTLKHALSRYYGAYQGGNSNIGLNPGHQRVALVRVPRYTSVSVSSDATLSTAAWDGSRGGVLALTSNSSIVVEGSIDMSGAGFRGGPSLLVNEGNGLAWQGESITGMGIPALTANFGGGGGGCFDGYSSCGNSGGGGGHASRGGAAPAPANCVGTDIWCSSGSEGGRSYAGPEQSTQFFLGSGGGGSSSDRTVSCSPGGNGGGIIMLKAATEISVRSHVLTGVRADGTSASFGAWVGGGGAGGSILLRSPTLCLGEAMVSAVGGPPASTWIGDGQPGGFGVIRIAGTDVTGTTVPSYLTP
ncbi:MAG: hypothetical protein JXR83_19620 [Deltaproteobacteria bacterium]|nr:hypothetical protein [Deltaproteobacteria bacterium]